MNQTRAFHATVRGVVQGVGFRFSALLEARRLGVVGYVRNDDFDGSVEVYAEGDAESLEHFESWLHEGPPGARVDSLTIEYRSPGGYYASFVVEH